MPLTVGMRGDQFVIVDTSIGGRHALPMSKAEAEAIRDRLGAWLGPPTVSQDPRAVALVAGMQPAQPSTVYMEVHAQPLPEPPSAPQGVGTPLPIMTLPEPQPPSASPPAAPAPTAATVASASPGGASK